jgi:hypothetical protein
MVRMDELKFLCHLGEKKKKIGREGRKHKAIMETIYNLKTIELNKSHNGGRTGR